MVEIIPKQAVKYPKWTNIMLGISFLLLIASFVSVLAFKQLQANTANVIDGFNIQLDEGKTQEELQLERKVFLYRDKLDDFARVAGDRTYPISFFPFIEQQVHEKVFFTSLNLTPKENKAHLLGEAATFQVLAEQLAILKTSDKVQGIQLSSIEFGKKGEVLFGLEMDFKQDFFTTRRLIEIEPEPEIL